MTKPKDALELVPIEVLRVIPLYNGDKTQLNLFLRKCEYVIDMYKGNDEQNLYLLHTITSRLVDRAASLLSERGDVNSWNKLKDLLIENYSDTRSEESIELEFQSLKINPSENFSSFYKRLQALHRILISKVDNNIDEAEKCKKVDRQTFGGTQSVGSSQGSLFGCSSSQAQSGQNKKGSSIFGLSQNGTSPFGLPQNGTLSYAGFGQGNNSGIKTNIPSQSVAPTSQALHLNEEE
ncbi:cytadhesion [Danaus plexippus plexippus]|uniref:Cytadhesion n=1 Tax=Danaus plexippus plexippus TaxID=278856 RepID=A0A212FLC5_DANPL|nr:cytadhesion [Danaus plexippus plexippus]